MLRTSIFAVALISTILVCSFFGLRSAHTSAPIASKAVPQLDASASHRFIGIVILYKDGEYVNAVASNKTYGDIKECLEIANGAISKATADGTIPENGNAIGACIPIPTLKKAPKEPKPTPEQGTL